MPCSFSDFRYDDSEPVKKRKRNLDVTIESSG